MTIEVRFKKEKIAGEKVVITFDFTSELPTGVTLSGTPTITVETRRGVDSSPSAMLNGAAQIDATSKMVLQAIQGGLGKREYAFTCLCDTTDPSIKLGRIGVLQVI